MKLRILMAAALGATAALIPSTASAKGVTEVKLTGPGLTDPIHLDGAGNTTTPAGALTEMTGLYTAFSSFSSGAGAPPMPSAPPVDLGPRYVVRYFNPYGVDGEETVRQDLYPFAEAGALVYTPPGQVLLGGESIEGWRPASDGLRRHLVSLGVPTPGQLAARAEPVTAASKREHDPPSAKLPCEAALADGQGAILAEPDPGLEPFLDMVALPTNRALQAIPRGETNSDTWLFAKTGLVVRSGTEFELVVPKRWRDRLSVRWAGSGDTDRLRVEECDGPTDSWLAFPGGYLVRDPACVPLIIRTDDGEVRARIGVGIPCPGQEPVPEDAPNFDDFRDSNFASKSPG